MKKILISLFLIFCLGSLGNSLYIENLDFLNLSSEQAKIQWIIGLIRDVGFWLFSALAIIYSIYNLNGDKNGSAKFYVFVSVTFSLYWSVLPTYTYIKLAQTPPVRVSIFKERPDFYENYQNFLDDNDKNEEELKKTTVMIASTIYHDTGVVVPIIDDNGNKTPFVPSDDDRKTYNDLVHAENLINHTKKSVKLASITNWSVMILSVLIGLLIARMKNKVSSSSV